MEYVIEFDLACKHCILAGNFMFGCWFWWCYLFFFLGNLPFQMFRFSLNFELHMAFRISPSWHRLTMIFSLRVGRTILLQQIIKHNKSMIPFCWHYPEMREDGYCSCCLYTSVHVWYLETTIEFCFVSSVVMLLPYLLPMFFSFADINFGISETKENPGYRNLLWFAAGAVFSYR